MKSPEPQPPKKPQEGPIEPLVAEARPAVTPDSAAPAGSAESGVTATGSTVRRAKTEDFAFLSQLPARKPEIFDRDAIKRATILVGGLALGLWIVMIIARPPASEAPEPEPPAESFVQEVPPITSTGNGLAPAPQDLGPTPEIISLTPAPGWTPQPPAPPQPQAMQAPAAQAPATPSLGTEHPETSVQEAVPAVADTPDPSNLF